ncbi:short chain dehydrogenase [Massarina eburnea CBS 473.64]|uniref:Short chain dehydrogenase n=1 Tax=Massarina eburnea CBS 473.64 TaxID=1395130 RepID=A0A6A6S4M4_9PLEO|nr:short chain dehydrogenase [Massarina eburnea CBS 473.64]
MSSHKVYNGKLAIITGSSRSFGAVCAEHFASRGANVVINYATKESAPRAEALAKRFESEYKVKALPVHADLSKLEAPQQLVDAAKAHFSNASGGFQIDIIVNNAATVNAQSLKDLDVELWDATFNLNAKAPALLVKAAFPYLPTDRSGRIVNISSSTTTWGVWWQTSYAGTKGALEAMTRVWARELAENCTVNSVQVGPMDTGLYNGLPDEPKEALRPFNTLTPLAKTREGVDSPEVLQLGKEIGGRPAYLEEVAGVVGMICLPQSGWMTGNLVGANGGASFVR